MKNFKENNKGFSLVELIVVIAIMVVLIAVLGSTILGYVDKSKYSKDITALDAINTAVKTYVAEPDSNYTSGTLYKLSTLMSATNDPNQVLSSILAEVFDSTGNFVNASDAFDGITKDSVLVCITDGAVAIKVPSSKTPKFKDYTAGDVSTMTGKTAQ